MIIYRVSSIFLYVVFRVTNAAAPGSPEWDRLLADHSSIQPVRKDDDLHAYFYSFPPIPAYEHAVDSSKLSQSGTPSTMSGEVKRKDSKRKLLQNPKNVARRLRYAQNKLLPSTEVMTTTKAEKVQALNAKAGQRKATIRANLKLPGNEEALRDYKASASEYNQRYRSRLMQELYDGTISKEKKERYEKRKQAKNERNKARNRKSSDTAGVGQKNGTKGSSSLIQ